MILALCLSVSCSPSEKNKPDDGPKEIPVTEDFTPMEVTSDKAVYAPGEEVRFRGSVSRTDLGVRYWHLGDVIETKALSGSKEWTWTPPEGDFQGYMAEVVAKDKDGVFHTVSTCAVDVSSDWTYYPRYGYLSRFCNCNAVQREKIIYNLNRFHINSLQYYEWAYDHHHPLAGTPENPMEEWDKYLMGSTCQLEVIQGYISSGHKYGMASLFYDLNNGVFEWCEEDGCGYDWYTYKDQNHLQKDYHDLPVPPFRSNLYLVNPALDAWLNYFSKQIDDVYKVFDFDGFQIDQLGDRGTVYDYYGKVVDLPYGYGRMINAMKKAQPDKVLVFNAVSGYGQKEIAASPVSFLYNEVWNTQFGDIKTTLDRNYEIDPSRNTTVLAAYMHNANNGSFNTPAVLLTDAVMFAMGASHIELGETLICQIYWPSCKMEVPAELDAALVEYYDFLTAYENLLRDGGKEAKINVTSPDIPVVYWVPERGKVNVYARQKEGKTIVHLLNFKDAVHMYWRDDDRTQAEPKEIKDFTLEIPTAKRISRVWGASPDVDGGAPRELEFESASSGVRVKVPYLKYWTMIVVE